MIKLDIGSHIILNKDVITQWDGLIKGTQGIIMNNVYPEHPLVYFKKLDLFIAVAIEDIVTHLETKEEEEWFFLVCPAMYQDIERCWVVYTYDNVNWNPDHHWGLLNIGEEPDITKLKSTIYQAINPGIDFLKRAINDMFDTIPHSSLITKIDNTKAQYYKTIKTITITKDIQHVE